MICIKFWNVWVRGQCAFPVQPFPRSNIFSNTKAPPFTYGMQNNSKIFPDLKNFGLWFTIRSVEIDELLCLDNVAFVSPLFVHYFLTSKKMPC